MKREETIDIIPPTTPMKREESIDIIPSTPTPPTTPTMKNTNTQINNITVHEHESDDLQTVKNELTPAIRALASMRKKLIEKYPQRRLDDISEIEIFEEFVAGIIQTEESS